MTRALVVFALLALGSNVASADDAADAHLATGRELYDKGDFDGARAEILLAYQLDPQPPLLFALGQLEFNLHHYQAAIDYYERFEATHPDAEQGKLAEQAIGAARAELSRPPPVAPTPPTPPTPSTRQALPPPHRQWDGLDTGLAAFGGLAIAAAGGLLYEALHLANNHAGTIGDYDTRVLTARHIRIISAASGAAGIVAIGAALLRWEFHFVDSTLEVHASSTGVGISLEHAL